MIKKYRVIGLVTYQIAKGMRSAIPGGHLVEVDERDFEEGGEQYAARMTWTDLDGKRWQEKWTANFWTQLARTQLKEE